MTDNLTTFATDYPAEAAWLDQAAEHGSDFAASLRAGVRKYGSLTPRQLAAVQRIVEQDAERARLQEQVQRVDVSPIVEAFAAAKANGLKRPKLRLPNFAISAAPENGANPGALYIKNGPTYLGKIDAEGRYTASREATPETMTAIAAAMVNPLEAAVAYGRETGNCALCGRFLENPESVALGVGPICRRKWGLG